MHKQYPKISSITKLNTQIFKFKSRI